MYPVGNDIVDLKTADALGKAGDFRFVERVLTRDEQSALRRSEHPDALLWAFWAAKEAAYKAISKRFPDISSAPRRYPVAIEAQKRRGAASGIVNTPRGRVFVRIFFYEDCIHCIASTGSPAHLPDIVHGMGEIGPGRGPASARESAAVRKVAGARIAAFLGRLPEDVRILRKTGPRGLSPPTVYIRGEKAPIDISMSHDGRFAAFVFQVMPDAQSRKKLARLQPSGNGGIYIRMIEQVHVVHIPADPLAGLRKEKVVCGISMPAQSAAQGHQAVSDQVVAYCI